MIENLKDLERLLKLCRRQGVQEIELGTVKLKLGDLPVVETPHVAGDTEPRDPYVDFPDVVLTPEQLMFYSAGGVPADDPALGGEP
jgi:hypothetical protein